MGHLMLHFTRLIKKLTASGSTYKGMNGILLLIMEEGNKRQLRP